MQLDNLTSASPENKPKIVRTIPRKQLVPDLESYFCYQLWDGRRSPNAQ